VTIGAYVLAIPASVLPLRWRRALRLPDDLPCADMSILSALAQFVACMGLGVLGYFAWIHAQYAAMDARYTQLDTTGAMGKEDYTLLGYTSLSMNPVLPLIFIFTSPIGFATALFMVSALVRVVHQGVTREPGADPVLGGIDALLAMLNAKRRVKQREASKAAGPDRITAGDAAAGFALRIDSNVDYDLRQGITVQIGQEFYRVLRVREMKTSGGMRILYDLETMPQGVAVRGMRRYDPPPGVVRP
jgi:hypothetical protein